MMSKKEVKQKIIKLPRKSNAIGRAKSLNCVAGSTWLSASFTDEHASPVPSSRILKASIVYSHNLMPKLKPQGHY
ncbi:hypothetical protein BC332_14582 [Capsicum chinense]|nr:hypothetical protein BC332_14582 [Capsicum chinense]